MRAGRLLVALVAAALWAGPAVAGPGAEDKKDKPPEKEKAKPARTFTNEDLKKYKEKPQEGSSGAQDGSADARGGSRGASTETDEAAAARERNGRQRRDAEPAGSPSKPEEAQAEGRTEPGPAATEAKSPEETEWKARATQARRPLDDAQGRINGIEQQMADLRDRLNPMSANYVLGGNSNAGPGQVYEIEEKLRNLEGELTAAKADLAEAEKSWQKFLDEARSAGASPAWLTP